MINTLSDDLSGLKFDEFLKSGFIFQSPDRESFWLGVLEIGSLEDHIFCHQNFYSTKLSYSRSRNIYKVSTKSLLKFISSHCPRPLKLALQETTDDSYIKDVADCLSWIKSDSKLKKLVAVTRAKYEASEQAHPLSRIHDLNRLRGQIYGVWHSRSGVIGCSPEILFNKSGAKFKTTALAGTISTREENFEQKMMSDQKEKEEHLLVVEGIKKSLEMIGSNLEIEETKVTIFGELAHMRTNLSFESNVSPIECIKALHPTAALGGDPKDICLSYLRRLRYFELDKSERSFGGIYGVNLGDEYYSLVGIRNVYWREDNYFIHSGSGIVSESTVEGELGEVRKKRESIAKAFS